MGVDIFTGILDLKCLHSGEYDEDLFVSSSNGDEWCETARRLSKLGCLTAGLICC